MVVVDLVLGVDGFSMLSRSASLFCLFGVCPQAHAVCPQAWCEVIFLILLVIS